MMLVFLLVVEQTHRLTEFFGMDYVILSFYSKELCNFKSEEDLIFVNSVLYSLQEYSTRFIE